jgi:hypothetical protein
VEHDVELVGALGEERGGLTAELTAMLEAPAAVRAGEYLAAAGDDIEAVARRPGKEADRLANPVPALAAVARLEQTMLGGRDDVLRVIRVHREVDYRARPLQFVAATVGADEQSVVRGVVAVDPLAAEAQNMEVGLTEQRDRLPALAGVGRLD